MAKKSGLSLVNEIYALLKERVVNLNYRPGEILLIQQVVNELKVSRTPVKEAMVRLVSDGYLEMYDNRYFRVREITVKSIMGIFETRQVLEGHVVEKLAAIIKPEWIEELDEILRQNDIAFESHDSAKLMRCDEQFHSAIMEFYGNDTIRDIFFQLNERIRALRFMTQVGQRVYLIGQEHRKVIDALKQGDGALASQMMSEHLERVKKSMLTVLEQREHPLIANTMLVNNIQH